MLQEVAYLAYYFHWPHAEIMQMRHLERLGWVEQLAQINKQLNEEAGDGGRFV